uniref:Secreted protein n=1 Tax=Ixodes ricinus TaxID=34613 RepID=A0A6B0U192_IXORI
MMTKTTAVLVTLGGMSLHTSGFTSDGIMLPPEASYLHGFWISVVAITQIIQVVRSSKTATEKAAKLVFNQCF